MAEVAFQYNDGYSENIVSFANNGHTPEGGMHEEGFKRALTLSLIHISFGLFGQGIDPVDFCLFHYTYRQKSFCSSSSHNAKANMPCI